MAGIDEDTKRQLKRRFRRQRRSALTFGQQADQKIERLLIRRFDRLVSVRRFVALWIALFVLLILSSVFQARSLSVYYQSLQPVPGGLFTEGVVGAFTDANPLYATGEADAAASHLVFSGLFKYDTSNRLVGDLAKDYSLNASQTRYTVHLRHGLTWHDGKKFSADDVVFTYKTIQNIEAQSPLYSSWQGISVSKQDNYTVNFDLPNAYSAFPYSLINGIVPAHLLKGIPPEQLRSSPFNNTPVGTGPFEWKFIEVTGNNPEARQQRLSLSAFSHYQGGRPKLDGFNLITFSDDQHMISAFQDKQINSMSGLETVPSQLKQDKSIQVYVTPLTTAVMTFFNNSNPVLTDANVRRALVLGVDRSRLQSLFDQSVRRVDSPLLKGQLGYDSHLIEPSFNLAAANQTLDQAGWTKNAQGQRVKNGQPLKFTLSAQDSTNYTKVAQFLQDQWSKIGVQAEVSYYSRDELQSSVVSNHDYDALLYGISIGVDPDIFAYWDSSQAAITSQGHLNLSEYKSAAADQSIEAGRTRSDTAVRAVKYHAFLTQWVKDLPALALYQPNYLYISRGPVFNYEQKAINASSGRFYDVSDWMIRQKRQTNK